MARGGLDAFEDCLEGGLGPFEDGDAVGEAGGPDPFEDSQSTPGVQHPS